MSQRLSMGRDSLTSWLRSVKEAKRHQENFRASLTKLPGRFFKPKRKTETAPCTIGTTSTHPIATAETSILETKKNLMLHEIDPG